MSNVNNINNSMNQIPNMGFWKSLRTTASSLSSVVAAGAVTANSVATALVESSEDLTKLAKDSIRGAQASVEEWRLKCEAELQAFQEDVELYKARQKILNRREWLSDLSFLTEAEINSLVNLIKEGK